jgi:hypothetical protein
MTTPEQDRAEDRKMAEEITNNIFSKEKTNDPLPPYRDAGYSSDLWIKIAKLDSLDLIAEAFAKIRAEYEERLKVSNDCIDVELMKKADLETALKAAQKQAECELNARLSGVKHTCYVCDVAEALRAQHNKTLDMASGELERAFEECETLNLLHGAARVRSLRISKQSERST